MKKFKFLSIMMLMIMPIFMACGNDDKNVKTVNKADFIGTWYSLTGGGVQVVDETTITAYELSKGENGYELSSEPETIKYTLDGDKVVALDGVAITISIEGNTLVSSRNEQRAYFTKYNGTLQQLIDYLNSNY